MNGTSHLEECWQEYFFCLNLRSKQRISCIRSFHQSMPISSMERLICKPMQSKSNDVVHVAYKRDIILLGTLRKLWSENISTSRSFDQGWLLKHHHLADLAIRQWNFTLKNSMTNKSIWPYVSHRRRTGKDMIILGLRLTSNAKRFGKIRAWILTSSSSFSSP